MEVPVVCLVFLLQVEVEVAHTEPLPGPGDQVGRAAEPGLLRAARMQEARQLVGKATLVAEHRCIVHLTEALVAAVQVPQAQQVM